MRTHLAAACILSLVLRSFGEPFRRVVTQQPGPRMHLTLCYPIDCSPPDSSVYEIFQARILEWLAIPFLRGIFLT